MGAGVHLRLAGPTWAPSRSSGRTDDLPAERIRDLARDVSRRSGRNLNGVVAARGSRRLTGRTRLSVVGMVCRVVIATNSDRLEVFSSTSPGALRYEFADIRHEIRP